MSPLQALSPLTFGAPTFLASIPLAALLYALLRRDSRAALAPSLTLVRQLPPTLRLRIRTPVLALLTSTVLALLAIASSRPQRISVVESSTKRRNLVLALDISRSMSAVDFASGQQQLSRISAVKRVVRKFIDARSEDRIGVVVFGSKAFVQAPLTLDHALINELVSDLSVGIAGDGTAIGDGLGLALKRLKDFPSNSSTVILLTDGASNSGQIEPQQAAEIAKAAGIKVHTIGIGSDTGVLSPGMFGLLQGAQKAEFDEESLKHIAEATGGTYFNARNLAGLIQVYEQIDQLERTSHEDPQQRVVDERFAPLCLAALLGYVAVLLCSRVWLLRVP